MNQLWKVDYQKIIREWEQDENIQLAPEQAEAVKASVDHGGIRAHRWSRYREDYRGEGHPFGDGTGGL